MYYMSLELENSNDAPPYTQQCLKKSFPHSDFIPNTIAQVIGVYLDVYGCMPLSSLVFAIPVFEKAFDS